MTANDNKSYLDYLIKSVDEYSNTYHCSIDKNLLMLIILLWLKKLSRVIKLLNLKLVIGAELLIAVIFLAKRIVKIGDKKYLWLIQF